MPVPAQFAIVLLSSPKGSLHTGPLRAPHSSLAGSAGWVDFPRRYSDGPQGNIDPAFSLAKAKAPKDKSGGGEGSQESRHHTIEESPGAIFLIWRRWWIQDPERKVCFNLGNFLALYLFRFETVKLGTHQRVRRTKRFFAERSYSRRRITD